MSAEATSAMWTNAKLTKRKSRKLSAHLLDWFKKSVTAKEPDVDVFGTKPQVKQKYDSLKLKQRRARSNQRMTSRNNNGSSPSGTGLATGLRLLKMSSLVTFMLWAINSPLSKGSASHYLTLQQLSRAFLLIMGI
jgi:hypothetical protein